VSAVRCWCSEGGGGAGSGEDGGSRGIASALVSQMMIDPGRVGLAREHGDREEGGGAVEACLPSCRRGDRGWGGGGKWKGSSGRPCRDEVVLPANAGVTRSQPPLLSEDTTVGCRLLLQQEAGAHGGGKDICVLALDIIKFTRNKEKAYT